MKKITSFFILLSSFVFTQTLPEQGTFGIWEKFACKSVAGSWDYDKDLYAQIMVSMNNPSQADADYVKHRIGVYRPGAVEVCEELVWMSYDEMVKYYVDNSRYYDKSADKLIEEAIAFHKGNQRTTTDEQEQALQGKIRIEASKDKFLNKETYDTEYDKHGKRSEDKRYNSDGEYVGRYHYQYYGDAWGTERDSKDENEVRTGRILWWYPSGYLENEYFWENGRSVSKKCFADNSSNEEISCP